MSSKSRANDTTRRTEEGMQRICEGQVRGQGRDAPAPDTRSEDLRSSPMMTHLLNALDEGTDIGHYGRLVFVMVARFFLDENELVRLVAKQPDQSEEDARALVAHVRQHHYNPPSRERMLEWQARQDFPLCPDTDDPQACNVYRELRFPEGIYDNIQEFWEERTEERNEGAQQQS
jgi:hypothetical protein